MISARSEEHANMIRAVGVPLRFNTTIWWRSAIASNSRLGAASGFAEGDRDLWLLKTWSARTETPKVTGRLAVSAYDSEHVRVFFAPGQYHFCAGHVTAGGISTGQGFEEPQVLLP
jgi:hypothetical protein